MCVQQKQFNKNRRQTELVYECVESEEPNMGFARRAKNMCKMKCPENETVPLNSMSSAAYTSKFVFVPRAKCARYGVLFRHPVAHRRIAFAFARHTTQQKEKSLMILKLLMMMCSGHSCGVRQIDQLEDWAQPFQPKLSHSGCSLSICEFVFPSCCSLRTSGWTACEKCFLFILTLILNHRRQE